jgi:hypothetical protein
VRNKRLGDACHWWTFATLTKSSGAQGHYDRRPAAGDHHNAALRNLANKLLGRIWWCLHNGELWDDNAAWNLARSHPGSCLALTLWDVYVRTAANRLANLVEAIRKTRGARFSLGPIFLVVPAVDRSRVRRLVAA